jgi:hypothetical protein
MEKKTKDINQVNIGLFFTPPEGAVVQKVIPRAPGTSSYQQMEEYLLRGLPDLMERHKRQEEASTIETEENKPINALFPGKVRIVGTRNGNVIEINNKTDTEILKNRTRKDFLDPLVAAEVAKETTTAHEDDFEWD